MFKTEEELENMRKFINDVISLVESTEILQSREAYVVFYRGMDNIRSLILSHKTLSDQFVEFDADYHDLQTKMAKIITGSQHIIVAPSYESCDFDMDKIKSGTKEYMLVEVTSDQKEYRNGSHHD